MSRLERELRGGAVADVPKNGYSLHVQMGSGILVTSRIFFINLLVYGAWKLNDLRVRNFLSRWFLTGYGWGPRAWAQGLLSTYSHYSLFHFGANMLGLFSFGPRTMDGWETLKSPKLSPLEFMGLYTASGMASSLASANFSQRWGTGRSGLGASGSLFAISTYAILCHQDMRVLVFFVLDMPALHALGGMTLINAGMVVKEVMAARGRSACTCTFF